VNVTVDEARSAQESERVYQENLERKVVVLKGARILSKDETVGLDDIELLEQYGMLDTGAIDPLPLVKVFAVMAVLSWLLFVFCARFCGKTFHSAGAVSLLASVVLFTLLLCRLLYPLHPLAMPVFIAPFLLAYLLGLRVAVVSGMYLMAAISMFTGMEAQALAIGLVGCCATALLTHNVSQRSRFPAAAFAAAALNAALYAVMSGDIARPEAYAADAGVLFASTLGAGVLAMGLNALLESAFNTATPLRLTELSSGNNALLQRLSFEAPGTHHHSLMVGYMAAAAAAEVGADAFIARAGGYYHDVGKLMNPEYFTENQSGYNPHDDLPPEESCRVIVAHTRDGVELCQKAKLPAPILDIVREHHGDTPVSFFYSKACKLYGAGAVRAEDYRYPGPRPSSRESAIVMLADSCEAAVRSAGAKDEGAVRDWIDKIITMKFNDGQLENSEISMRELNRIATCFLRVLSGYYHSRVKYPDEPQPAAVAPGEELGALPGAAVGGAGGGAGGAGDGPAGEPGGEPGGAPDGARAQDMRGVGAALAERE
jgi:putative nucleotidyltransferase with HDIG domain